MDPAIRIRSLSKRYVISSDKAGTLKETVLGIFRRPERETVEALARVDLEVPQGETLGIIGQNGAGKSTLLKLISGVSEPSGGSIEVHGSLMALIELGAGFQQELSGLENIYLQGSVMGLPEKQITALLPQIVEFADLQKFIRTPVKHYSSGMVLRLGFAIAAFVEPDIILLDENLAVGDVAFQTKCVERLRQLRGRGATIVMVTHQLDMAEWLCDRIVWLNNGVIEGEGWPKETIKRYERTMADKPQTPWDEVTRDQSRVAHLSGRFGTGEAVIRECSVLDEEGDACHIVQQGASVRVRVVVESSRDLPEANLEVSMSREDRLPVFLLNLELLERIVHVPRGRSAFEVELPRLALSPGRYFLNVGVSPARASRDFYDMHLHMYHFRIVSERQQRLLSVYEAPVRIEVRAQ